MQVHDECHVCVIYHLSEMEADRTYFAEDLRMTKPQSPGLDHS